MPWDSSTAPRQHPELLHQNQSCLGLYLLGASDAAEELQKGCPSTERSPGPSPAGPARPLLTFCNLHFFLFLCFCCGCFLLPELLGGKKEVSKGWVTTLRTLCSLEVTAWGSQLRAASWGLAVLEG